MSSENVSTVLTPPPSSVTRVADPNFRKTEESHRQPFVPATTGEEADQLTPEQQVMKVATELFRQSPDWVTFFREILGVEGVVHMAFTDVRMRRTFESIEEYGRINTMVAKLRKKSQKQSGTKEPTRVITVRLPKGMHAALRSEGHDHKTSLNQLCISKLLQMIDQGLVPSVSTD